MLNSTVWNDNPLRNIFITALLMADPREFPEAIKQIAVDSLELTGWEAPPGWYGFVPSAGTGIIQRAIVDSSVGMEALRKLGEPDILSRSQDFEGRRMIRIEGGYAILNYMKFRDHDYSAADRMRKMRARKKALRNSVTVHPNVPTVTVQANVTHSREQRAEDREQRTEVKIISGTDFKKDTIEKPSAHKVRSANGPVSNIAKNGAATGQSRHSRIQGMVIAAWSEHNSNEQCPWGAGDAKQLQLILGKCPSWPDTHFAQCLQNMYASDGFPRSELPVNFLPRLPGFFSSARNTYNREVNGNGSGHSKADQRSADNRATAQRVFEKLTGETTGVRRSLPTKNEPG